jgi:hypothetical protein
MAAEKAEEPNWNLLGAATILTVETKRTGFEHSELL